MSDLEDFVNDEPEKGGPSRKSQKFMVLVGSGDAEQLVEFGCNLYREHNQEWTVAHVSDGPLSDLNKQSTLLQSLQLAESLGAHVVTLSGHNLVDEVLAYAKEHAITHLVIGRSRRRWRLLRFRTSLSSALLRRARRITITIVSPDGIGVSDVRTEYPWKSASVVGLVSSFLATAIGAGLSWVLSHYLSTANLSLVFLLAVLIVAIGYGRTAALIAAILSFLVFNYFFTEPLFTFRVSNKEDIFTLFFFLIVALIVGQLGARLRRQVLVIRDNSRLTSLLYEFSKRLNATEGAQSIARCLENYLREIVDTSAIVMLDKKGRLGAAQSGLHEEVLEPGDMDAAETALENGSPTGRGTQVCPNSKWFFVPLTGAKHRLGVIGLHTATAAQVISPVHRRIVFALRDQATIALERQRLSEEVSKSKLETETERLRSALLSSISHDLRTPLASIIGSASSLLEMENRLDPCSAHALLTGLLEEAERLNRFVQNLLDMTRLGYGAVKTNLEWHDLGEIASAAIRRVGVALRGVVVKTSVPEDSLIFTDANLLTQVLANLLDNSAKYSPVNSTISVTASISTGKCLRIGVEDEGQGIPLEDRERVFDLFYRADKRDRQGAGTGLGLSICRDMVKLLGGRIRLVDGPNGKGIRVEMEFPQPPQPVQVAS